MLVAFDRSLGFTVSLREVVMCWKSWAFSKVFKHLSSELGTAILLYDSASWCDDSHWWFYNCLLMFFIRLRQGASRVSVVRFLSFHRSRLSDWWGQKTQGVACFCGGSPCRVAPCRILKWSTSAGPWPL